MYKPLRRAISPLYPLAHHVLAQRHPQALWGGNPTLRSVALTFDDGPSLRDTPALLQTLARHGVAATFFVLGERLWATPPSLLREIHAAGHQVAIHGYRHKPFPLGGAPVLRRELGLTRDLIAEACGVPPKEVRDVRPPFGLYTSRLLRELWRWQYRPVMWSMAPPHWAQTQEQTIRQLVRGTSPGALIVLHEGQPCGPAIAEIVDAVLPRLLSQGLEFVSVEQMWQARTRSGQPSVLDLVTADGEIHDVTPVIGIGHP